MNKNFNLKKISLIWLLPFLAFIIAFSIFWQNTINTGKTIELVVNSAQGIEPDKTLVKLRSVVVGKVKEVRLDDSFTKAILKVQMNKGTDEMLKEDTSFWIVKPRIATTGVSGLETLLSGPYIELFIGQSNKYRSTFEVFDEQPKQFLDHDGIFINLQSDDTRSINLGDSVVYKGFNVGNVVNVQLDSDTKLIDYTIFIQKKYTSLLNASTRFWVKKGINVDVNANGLKLQTSSFDEIFYGIIEFDNVGKDIGEFDVNKKYALYENLEEAEFADNNYGVNYIVNIPSNIKHLNIGSLVIYKGVVIGKVLKSPYFDSYLDIYSNNEFLPVLISLNAKNDKDKEYIKSFIDNKIQKGTIAASFGSDNLLQTNNRIELLDLKENKKDNINIDLNVIPFYSTLSIQDKINDILDDISKIDFEGISDNLNQALKNTSLAMQAFTENNKSVKNEQLIKKLTETFSNFNNTVLAYGESGDIYFKLNSLVIKLNSVLDDLKKTSVTLSNKSNSLIFDTKVNDLEPKKQD